MLLSTGALLSVFALAMPPDTGAVLYRAWCSSCHGADGRGVSAAMTRLEVPAADLAACAISSAEPEENWIRIVRDGGAAVGLSMDMPSFGENATREQIAAIVRYTRSLCAERGWPPGELNFPRAFFAEKAFPENEVVVVAHDREQELLYERRIGKRFQVEGAVRSVFDGGSVFGGVSAGAKYNVFHDLARGLIASIGVEVVPPVGRQDELEVEPFVAFGASPGTGFVVQGEVLATVEDGFNGVTVNTGLGMAVNDRFVPMLEASWTVPRTGGQLVSLAPQIWIRLSRLGHVAGSVGLDIPVRGPGSPRLAAFVLWDFGDGAINRGW